MRHNPLYDTARWLRRRETQLRHEPLCRYCAEQGLVVQAEVADHVVPHRGDRELFFQGELQSLCWKHHSGAKQRQEKGGFTGRVGPDGFLVGEKVEARQFSIPVGLKPSRVLVHVVCGPPGSGKTTFVRERRRPDDVVVDLDDIKERLCGDRYTDDPYWLKKAFGERERLLHGLATTTANAAWVIVGAPTTVERVAWKKALGELATIHIMTTSRQECKRRIAADPIRNNRSNFFFHLVDQYYSVRS